MNGLTRFLLSLSTFQRNHSLGNGLGIISGERRPCLLAFRKEEKLAFAKWYIQKVTITHFGSKNGFVIQRQLLGFFEMMNLVLIQYLSDRKSNWPYPHQKVAILIEQLTHKVNFRTELRGKTVACSSSLAVCRDFANKEFSELCKNFCASFAARKTFTKCLSFFFRKFSFFKNKRTNRLFILVVLENFPF